MMTRTDAHSFAFRAMNTGIELRLIPHEKLDAADWKSLENDVYMLFEQIEAIASRFRPDSELMLLNQSPGQDIAVSPLLFDLLSAAQEAYRETGGLFHPGLLTYLTAAGYDRSFEKIAERQDNHDPNAATALPLSPPASLPFEIDPYRKTVRLQVGMQIDLGGIAKGWTVDCAARYLEQYGDGFINGGGDLRVFGQRDDFWKIGVENPTDPSTDLGVLRIKQGAVATSSTQKRRWKQGDAWKNHLLDPRTSQPTESPLLSVTVTAPTARQADVWAKTILLLGPDAGTEFLRARGSQGVLVDREYQIRSVS